MAVEWSYYDKFKELNNKYLPTRGEGETMATQCVTAVNKLIYKWYNDGDVYDNTYALSGWCNDLSDYANWLHENTEARRLLEDIAIAITSDDYEDILKRLADRLLVKEKLERMNRLPKIGSVYDCKGLFTFSEAVANGDDEDEDEDW